MEELHFNADITGERIDKFLDGRIESLSRSYIQKLIKEKKILVNQLPVKANYKLTTGDTIILQIPDPEPLDIQPENIPLDILYEDDDILVVNKPKGMVVHPAPGHYSHTLVNAVLYHCGENLSGINGVIRPGIVHRIDMNTTGSLLICKNDKAHQILAEQLKEHSITRKYHAIVHGNLKEDTGTVNAPIGRHPTDRKKMSTKAPNGRHAVTHYRVLKDLVILPTLSASLKPVGHIRSVFICPVSDIQFWAMRFMVLQNVLINSRDRLCMQKSLVSLIHLQENI